MEEFIIQQMASLLQKRNFPKATFDSTEAEAYCMHPKYLEHQGLPTLPRRSNNNKNNRSTADFL